jgi:hypothetical protein
MRENRGLHGNFTPLGWRWLSNPGANQIKAIRTHVAACATAVCSLIAASAFLLHAVLLETTGRMENDMR